MGGNYGNWDNFLVPGLSHNGVAAFSSGIYSVSTSPTILPLNQSFTRFQILDAMVTLDLNGTTITTFPHYNFNNLPLTALIGYGPSSNHSGLTITNGTWNSEGRIQFLNPTQSFVNASTSLEIGRGATVNTQSIYAPLNQHSSVAGGSVVSILSQGTLNVSGHMQGINLRLNSGVLSLNSFGINTTFSGSQSGVVISNSSGQSFVAAAVANDLASFNVVSGKNAVVHSAGVATLGQTTTLSGGTIVAANGVAVGQSRSLQGFGSVNGPVIGQAGSSITATGLLNLGSNTLGGFRTDGALSVQSHHVRLHSLNQALIGGVATLAGGTLEAANNGSIAVGTGGVISGYGLVDGKIEGAAGSAILANGGDLTLGRAVTGGFSHAGYLDTANRTVTLLNATRSTLGSQTKLGNNNLAGTLVVSNGAYLDFGRTIVGFGTIDSQNSIAKAMIINGDVIGNSPTEKLTFNGYVKGIGTFENVIMNGTFAPGLSPAISSVDNLTLGNNAILEMEIGGLTAGTQFDKLIDSGLLTLNGTLKLILIDSFNPQVGQSLDLFDWNSLAGGFTNFDFSLAALDNGLMWDTSALYSTGTLTVAAVPEPSSLLLVVIGSVLAFTRRPPRIARAVRA